VSAAAARRKAALAWARQGNPVLPTSEDKAPLTQHGLKDASTDTDVVESWWRQWPDALVGVRLDDLLLIDRDNAEAETHWERLIAESATELIETAQAKTPRGLHDLFVLNGARPAKASGALAPGLEWRAGSGAYVVVPPGPGRTSLAPPSEVGLAAAPEWLLALVARDDRRRPAPPIGDVIPEGKRNDTLASLAGTMRRRNMDGDAILAALEVTNRRRCVPPLPDAQVRGIAESISRYSHAEPTVAEPWPAPAALDSPRPEFPLEALPAKLRAFVEALSTATQTPADLAAMQVLSVLSSAALGCAVIECAPGWEEELAIYSLTVLPSGERKSSVRKAAVAPLRKIERVAMDIARPRVAADRARRETLEERRKQLVRDVARGKADQRELDAVSFELAGFA
jgi:Bifunctional DNA primase/polymerase, N-terminal/Protein of unknown function (DUF3987)/Primase C terminal 1 (PriCT-1)